MKNLALVGILSLEWTFHLKIFIFMQNCCKSMSKLYCHLKGKTIFFESWNLALVGILSFVCTFHLKDFYFHTLLIIFSKGKRHGSCDKNVYLNPIGHGCLNDWHSNAVVGGSRCLPKLWSIHCTH